MHRVLIEICENCHTHQWCTRHKEERYKTHFSKVKAYLQLNFSSIQVSKASSEEQNWLNEERERIFGKQQRVEKGKLGSFQIFLDNILIFSKHQTNRWPSLQELSEIIRRGLEEHGRSGQFLELIGFLRERFVVQREEAKKIQEEERDQGQAQLSKQKKHKCQYHTHHTRQLNVVSSSKRIRPHIRNLLSSESQRQPSSHSNLRPRRQSKEKEILKFKRVQRREEKGEEGESSEVCLQKQLGQNYQKKFNKLSKASKKYIVKFIKTLPNDKTKIYEHIDRLNKDLQPSYNWNSVSKEKKLENLLDNYVEDGKSKSYRRQLGKLKATPIPPQQKRIDLFVQSGKEKEKQRPKFSMQQVLRAREQIKKSASKTAILKSAAGLLKVPEPKRTKISIKQLSPSISVKQEQVLQPAVVDLPQSRQSNSSSRLGEQGSQHSSPRRKEAERVAQEGPAAKEPKLRKSLSKELQLDLQSIQDIQDQQSRAQNQQIQETQNSKAVEPLAQPSRLHSLVQLRKQSTCRPTEPAQSSPCPENQRRVERKDQEESQERDWRRLAVENFKKQISDIESSEDYLKGKPVFCLIYPNSHQIIPDREIRPISPQSQQFLPKPQTHSDKRLQLAVQFELSELTQPQKSQVSTKRVSISGEPIVRQLQLQVVQEEQANVPQYEQAVITHKFVNVQHKGLEYPMSQCRTHQIPTGNELKKSIGQCKRELRDILLTLNDMSKTMISRLFDNNVSSKDGFFHLWLYKQGWQIQRVKAHSWIEALQSSLSGTHQDIISLLTAANCKLLNVKEKSQRIWKLAQSRTAMKQQLLTTEFMYCYPKQRGFADIFSKKPSVDVSQVYRMVDCKVFQSEEGKERLVKLVHQRHSETWMRFTNFVEEFQYLALFNTHPQMFHSEIQIPHQREPHKGVFYFLLSFAADGVAALRSHLEGDNSKFSILIYHEVQKNKFQLDVKAKGLNFNKGFLKGTYLFFLQGFRVRWNDSGELVPNAGKLCLQSSSQVKLKLGKWLESSRIGYQDLKELFLPMYEEVSNEKSETKGKSKKKPKQHEPLRMFQNSRFEMDPFELSDLEKESVGKSARGVPEITAWKSGSKEANLQTPMGSVKQEVKKKSFSKRERQSRY